MPFQIDSNKLLRTVLPLTRAFHCCRVLDNDSNMTERDASQSHLQGVLGRQLHGNREEIHLLTEVVGRQYFYPVQNNSRAANAIFFLRISIH